MEEIVPFFPVAGSFFFFCFSLTLTQIFRIIPITIFVCFKYKIFSLARKEINLSSKYIYMSYSFFFFSFE